jgi:hypothetical protein
MRVLYARRHRMSIYETATINDIPAEVHQNFLLYLLAGGHKDLVASTLVNRAWYPVAQELHGYWIRLDEKEVSERSICSRLLKEIVCGADSLCLINHLAVDLEFVDRKYIPILARLVSSTLRTLELDYFGIETLSHYVALDEFFARCHAIRNIKLSFFDFGIEPASISQTIKDGFYRLSQLSLEWCRGDLGMFVDSVTISNLLSFSDRGFGYGLIMSDIVINYPKIKRSNLHYAYLSPETLFKFIECCRGIEQLSFILHEDVELKQHGIEIIASLPLLKSLNIDCQISDNDVSPLSRCRRMKRLSLGPALFDLISVIPTIGRNLECLEFKSSIPCLETVYAIIEHCPYLRTLVLGWIWNEAEEEKNMVAVDLLKRGLKKLTILKVNGHFVRLGTDWEGYR